MWSISIETASAVPIFTFSTNIDLKSICNTCTQFIDRNLYDFGTLRIWSFPFDYEQEIETFWPMRLENGIGNGIIVILSIQLAPINEVRIHGCREWVECEGENCAHWALLSIYILDDMNFHNECSEQSKRIQKNKYFENGVVNEMNLIWSIRLNEYKKTCCRRPTKQELLLWQIDGHANDSWVTDFNTKYPSDELMSAIFFHLIFSFSMEWLCPTWKLTSNHK